MAITNGLCTLTQVKTALRISDTTDDTPLELAIEAASRMIETFCDRRFYADGTATARTFVAVDPCLVLIDDVSTTTGLVVKTDSEGSGTFATTWAATDYQLEPLNAVRNAQAWAYTSLRAVGSFTFPVWGERALVQVTAKWGWPAVPKAVEQAAVYQSMLLFKSNDVPLGATPFGEMGVLRMRSALHPTAMALLSDYVKSSAMVG